MNTDQDATRTIPLSVTILFFAVVGACTVAPWVAHFVVGWWSGPLVWFALVALYDKLFVPKGSICMGIPFMFPLGSFVLLLLFNLINLLGWLRN